MAGQTKESAPWGRWVGLVGMAMQVGVARWVGQAGVAM